MINRHGDNNVTGINTSTPTPTATTSRLTVVKRKSWGAARLRMAEAYYCDPEAGKREGWQGTGW